MTATNVVNLEDYRRETKPMPCEVAQSVLQSGLPLTPYCERFLRAMTECRDWNRLTVKQCSFLVDLWQRAYEDLRAHEADPPDCA